MSGALRRRDLVQRLLARRGEALVVTGLGAPSWDVAAAGDDARNFYLWGAMGAAAMVGLGLALAQPKRRVLVVTGDGEMLMGMSSLATVAAQKPANLAILVLDNRSFGETGQQPSLTAAGADLVGVARACGIATCLRLRSMAEVDAAAPALLEAPGPVFALAEVALEKIALALPARDGDYLRHRFRTAVLGQAAPLD